MNRKRLFTYALCLCAGGGVAWLVPGSIKESLAGPAGRPMRHVPEGQEVLSKDSTIFEEMEDLMRQLEEGTATLATVIDATGLLVAAVQLDMRASAEGIQLPLVWEGDTFGQLKKSGPDGHGFMTWVFELTLAPLPRYAGIADHAELTIAYSGTGGAITRMVAITQTMVHYSDATYAAIGLEPFVTGGSLTGDAESSVWRSQTLTVEFQGDTGVPKWTSETAEVEPREGSLGAVSSDGVAAALFSL